MSITPICRLKQSYAAPTQAAGEKLHVAMLAQLALQRPLSVRWLPVKGGGVFVVDCATQIAVSRARDSLKHLSHVCGCSLPAGTGAREGHEVQAIYRVAFAYTAPDEHVHAASYAGVLDLLRPTGVPVTWLPLAAGGLFTVECGSLEEARELQAEIAALVAAEGGKNLEAAP